MNDEVNDEMTEPEYTIIMSCKNNLEFTKQAVNSILEAAGQENFEFLITDDGSDDGTFDYLMHMESAHPQISIDRNEINIGVPKTLNNMMRKARGQFVVRVDNDICIATSSFLRHMRFWFEKIPSLGALSAITNRTSGPAGKKELKDVKMSFQYTDWLNGLCMMFRKSALEKVGFIDEKFPKMYGEDRDLVFRIVENGFSAGLCHNAFCFHKGRKTIDPNSEEGKHCWAKSNKLLEERYGKPKPKV